MFEGFDEGRLTLDQSEVYYRKGGSGPPVLLLHGFPQTHAAWHRVAPLLARHYTVVVPDLRGYGRSPGPAPDASKARRNCRTCSTASATAPSTGTGTNGTCR